jgi:hypothetical protein
MSTYVNHHMLCHRSPGGIEWWCTPASPQLTRQILAGASAADGKVLL